MSVRVSDSRGRSALLGAPLETAVGEGVAAVAVAEDLAVVVVVAARQASLVDAAVAQIPRSFAAASASSAAR